MVFGMTPRCPCCRDLLWHCEKCWDEHHNGKKHQDYEPPKHYGQSMSEKVEKIMEKELEIKIDKKIIADKNKPYNEGEYH